ncbi:MAG TPA: hypothetical protein VJS64_01350 [Pyrinomonadaceae bacterium]|nr:hypothetical protein [Pyrinomonadaceae bacterium]
MKTFSRLLIAIIIVLGLSAFPITAQFPNAGKLNTWTTRAVARRHGATEATYVRNIRVGRQRGFDRVVFEFSGVMPNYRVEYLKSRYYENEGGTQRIKIAGRAFVEVNLNVIPADEEQLKLREQKDFIPQGRLKLTSLLEIEEARLFEGYYDFLLGISARKAFRVTELSNPLRLVIDFRN